MRDGHAVERDRNAYWGTPGNESYQVENSVHIEIRYRLNSKSRKRTLMLIAGVAAADTSAKA